MGELKRWSKVEHDDSVHHLGPYYLFPRLRGLQIIECRKLMRLPSMPQLESLIARGILGELLISILASSSSTPTLKRLHIESIELISLIFRNQYLLRKLSIKDCCSLKNISDGMQCLSALETLRIENSKDFEAWNISVWEGLNSLRILNISDMPNLQVLPQGITCLTTLQHLSISGLVNLTALPEHISGLSQLCSLKIINCPKLTAIPQSVRGLTSLQMLKIDRCPDLKKRCEQPNGPDWPLIRHISTVAFGCF
ncbi:hypothetical protein RND81_05G087100 [Saponaria officinalis]|uniref:Disease resistance R13L4/SHOC-2-like LRR domain-containing protein n=1 Tax=Saponaria officinalis TaxID=3572 RepID=A0AAW1KYU2_SAPOF